MIQFLRGNAISVNSSVVVPADGQPVYNKTDKLLYIGDGATQLKNLEPIAGLNALIYNTVYETSNTSAPSSINATPQSFNRTPVLGDLALFIVSLHGFNSTYLCIYTVSNVSNSSVTCTLKSSVSITGSQGESAGQKLYQHKISYNGSLVGADSGNIYVYLVIISSEANAYTLSTLNNYLRNIDSGGYYPATGVTSNTSTSYTGGVYRIGYGAMGYPIATYYVTSGSMAHTSLMSGSSFHDIVTEL